MASRKSREVEVVLSEEVYNGAEAIAKKNGLKWEDVIGDILECELDIVEYAAYKRRKIAKELKIRPTSKFLYHGSLLR